MAKPKNDWTVDDLPEDLEYNPFTGIFKRGNRQLIGLNGRGYLQICLMGRSCYAHRVAWLLFYGHWPTGQIDHFNGVRSDNRIANLREVSRRINLQNRHTANFNKKSCGLLGVSWDSSKPKRRNRWRAHIRVNKKLLYLGNYHAPEEAHRAYLEAKRKYHPESFLTAAQSKGRTV